MRLRPAIKTSPLLLLAAAYRLTGVALADGVAAVECVEYAPRTTCPGYSSTALCNTYSWVRNKNNDLQYVLKLPNRV